MKHLLEIDKDDILCYCDSEYLFLDNIRTVSNEWLKDKEIGVSHYKPNQRSCPEYPWVKRDALELINLNKEKLNEYINSVQAWAGFIIMRKSFKTIRFISEWLTYAQDIRIISDNKSTLGDEYHWFVENRHDQAILSLLLKEWNIPTHIIDKYFLYNKRTPIHIDLKNSPDK